MYHNSTDTKFKASAALSLSIVYASGVGVKFDLSKTQEAAILGLKKAQILLINIVAPSMTNIQVLGSVKFLSWLEASAEAGNEAFGICWHRYERIETAVLA